MKIMIQWKYCIQISFSILFMSHDLLQPIRIGYLGKIQRDAQLYKGSNSIGVGTLKMGGPLRLIAYFIKRK